MPKAKTSQNVVAEMEIHYHPAIRPAARPIVQTSDDAYTLFMESWDMDKIDLQEQFRVMLLDRKNGCIGISAVATGGIAGCGVDLKIVFALALKALSSKIILAHNHPSGNKQPSENDKKLTERFAEVGRILELPVVDHLIVTREGFTSLRDECLIM